MSLSLGNYLDESQVVDLILAPDPDTRKGARDRAILAVLVGCGLRREELVELTYHHMRERDGRWVFEGHEAMDRRLGVVIIPTWCKYAIDCWTEASGRRPRPRDRIFVSILRGGRVAGDSITSQGVYYIVKDYCRRAGVPEVTPDDLRRTYNMLARKGSAPLEYLQVSLGYADVRSTGYYVRAGMRVSDGALAEQIGVVEVFAYLHNARNRFAEGWPAACGDCVTNCRNAISLLMRTLAGTAVIRDAVPILRDRGLISRRQAQAVEAVEELVVRLQGLASRAGPHPPFPTLEEARFVLGLTEAVVGYVVALAGEARGDS